MSNVVLGRTITRDFVCHATSGIVTDADTTPTCAVFEDANDTPILTPTVVKRTSLTGNYRVPIAVTAANGFEIGKSYNVVISATVGTISSKAVVDSFEIENIVMKTGAVVSDAGNSTTQFKTDLTEATNDYHKNALLLMTSGALINQVTKVTGYVGATKILNFSGALTGTASVADTFILLVY